jgi:hypothetical protein
LHCGGCGIYFSTVPEFDIIVLKILVKDLLDQIAFGQ